MGYSPKDRKELDTTAKRFVYGTLTLSPDCRDSLNKLSKDQPPHPHQSLLQPQLTVQEVGRLGKDA